MNNKFLNEAKELESRWAKSGLLEGIDDRFIRGQTAALLECQRLVNETAASYFSIVKNGKIVAQIPTKCTIASQIEEIDAFLRSNGILDEDTKVSLTGNSNE